MAPPYTVRFQFFLALGTRHLVTRASLGPCCIASSSNPRWLQPPWNSGLLRDRRKYWSLYYHGSCPVIIVPWVTSTLWPSGEGVGLLSRWGFPANMQGLFSIKQKSICTKFMVTKTRISRFKVILLVVCSQHWSFSAKQETSSDTWLHPTMLLLILRFLLLFGRYCFMFLSCFCHPSCCDCCDMLCFTCFVHALAVGSCFCCVGWQSQHTNFP